MDRPWEPIDTLWYDYRDPWAQGVPGAEAELLEIRRFGGWIVPAKHGHGATFIADGTSETADALTQEWFSR